MPAERPPVNSHVISLGQLVIDTSQLTVSLGGKQVHLTPTEFRLILMFVEQPGQVFSREDIARVVWDTGWSGDLRAVDVHIQRLRKKIGSKRISTVRGFGYRFVA